MNQDAAVGEPRHRFPAGGRLALILM